MIKEVNPFSDIPFVELPVQPANSRYGNQYATDTAEMRVGAGARAFYADEQGIWLGAKTFAGAVFSVSMTGALVATSATISGTIQTAASGQRIVITSADNTMRFYNATSQVIGIGTDGTYAFREDLNANNLGGIAILSGTDASIGMLIQNTGNVTVNGILISMLDTGSGNDGYGITIDHRGNSGSSYGLNINKENAGTAARIYNAGSGVALDISHAANTSAHALSIFQSHASSTGDALNVDQGGTGRAIYATGGSASNPTLYLYKLSAGEVARVVQSVNSASRASGIYFNIANSGAGTEQAFEFWGSEFVNAAVGGSQDYKIRVLVDGVVRYIPLHSS